MKDLLARDDWKFEYNKDGVEVKTYKTPEGYQCTKGEGIIEFDPEEIIEFLKDTKIKPTYDKNYDKGNDIASLGMETVIQY
jgi:hypothetical protein